MTPPDFISLDFETGSIADLKKVGAHAYARHPSTRVLCLSFTRGTWDPTPGPFTIATPPGAKGYSTAEGNASAAIRSAELELMALANHVKRGGFIHAWNATFEWLIWNHVFMPFVRDFYPYNAILRDFPELPLNQIRDTMARAAYWGLPLSLDTAAQALPQLGIQKDMAGRRLMLSMSRPRRVDPDTGEIVWWDAEDPDKAARLYEYCAQDVRTEAAIGEAIPYLPDVEQELWQIDAAINDFGVPFDRELADRMETLADMEQKRLNAELKRVTRGSVPSTTSVGMLTAYCAINGLPEADGGLAKDRLPFLIQKATDRGLGDVARVLELRQEAAKSSVAKLRSMRAFAGDDNQMRGLTQYYGAFRTGRWAGRGPQIQNFPRSAVKDQDHLVELLLDPDCTPAKLEAELGVTPLTAISSALRGCAYVPPATGTFAALDFSQIEARVLAWLCGNTKVLDAYRFGKDLYVVAAAGIYRIREGEVQPDQRQVGKVSVLALGYGGGVGAFQTMAKNYGLDVPDDQAEEIKTAWRNDNPAVVKYWYALNDAALGAVENPGLKYPVGAPGAEVTFRFWKGHLVCQLPSKRLLVYRDARIEDNRFGQPGVTYMGVDQYTRKWTRIETYGGKLCENITQAVARDVMAEAIRRLRYVPGVHILGSVHDEVLLHLDTFLVPVGLFDLARDKMRETPNWASGLPIDADGYTGVRFKKG